LKFLGRFRTVYAKLGRVRSGYIWLEQVKPIKVMLGLFRPGNIRLVQVWSD